MDYQVWLEVLYRANDVRFRDVMFGEVNEQEFVSLQGLLQASPQLPQGPCDD